MNSPEEWMRDNPNMKITVESHYRKDLWQHNPGQRSVSLALLQWSKMTLMESEAQSRASFSKKGAPMSTL